MPCMQKEQLGVVIEFRGASMVLSQDLLSKPMPGSV